MHNTTYYFYFWCLCLALFLSSCTEGMLSRLENVGNPPQLEKVDDPTAKPSYKPVSWPTPQKDLEAERKTNSIWQSDSKTFFRDPRARNVGDILTVKVNIKDSAAFDNTTNSSRTSTEKLGLPNLFGYESQIGRVTPSTVDTSNLLGLNGNSANTGAGKIDRKENIVTEVAALITQVLPNGNYVINGNQQIRVNYEMREVSIQGVIRPEDINADNTINSSQIAQARISYGGKGTISDVQQPRIGEQLIDILSPF